MKLGQALMLAASAAAAVGAAVYAKKKIENSEQADGLAAKGFHWKDLPEELNVIKKVKKKSPDKIIITTDGVRDADEPSYDSKEEDEVVTRLAEDIREVMSEDIFEAEEDTIEEASEELIEELTANEPDSEIAEVKPSAQKKSKQKKYYAPVDFTFTEEAEEAPVTFENVMEHFKKVELPEEEKAELEAHEDYSDVVAEDNKIFDEFLNAPIPKEEKAEIFNADDAEENAGLRDENEEKAFKEFVAAIAAETHPASAPLVVNEVTAIPDSEAEYIKTDAVLIPTIEKISDDDNEDEINEGEQPTPETEEIPVVEEIEDSPTLEETVEIPTVEETVEITAVEEVADKTEENEEIPVVEEVGEIPTVEEIAELPVVEEVEEIPTVEEIAELPVVEEVEEIPAVEEITELPVVEEVEEIPTVEEIAELPVVEEVEEILAVEEIAELPVVEEVEEILAVEEIAELPAAEEVAEIPAVEVIPVEEEIEETLKEKETWEIPVAEEISGDILGGFAEEIERSEYEKAEVNEFGAFFHVPEAVVEATKAAIAIAEKAEETQEETQEETAAEEEAPALQAETPKHTLDFFDKPVEEKKSAAYYDEVSMEDLFGDLLADAKVKTEAPITNPNEVFSMYENESVEEDDFDNLKDEKIEKEQEKIQTVDTRRVIVQEIADNIDSFAMLLEPLNSIKENKVRVKSGIIFDWEMRIQALEGDPPIKSYWRNNFNNYEIWTDEKHMEKAEELLSMLQLVGIERDSVKEVVIDRETMDFYSAQSEHMNNDFNLGETAVVVRPCWRINGKPLVKGEIAKKAPFADFGSKNVSLLEQMLRANKCEDGDVNIPVTEESFFSADHDIPYIKQAIESGVCKCAVRRMEGGTALAFFYEVINEGESMHRDAGTLRFEATIDKNCKIVGKFKGETV